MHLYSMVLVGDSTRSALGPVIYHFRRMPGVRYVKTKEKKYQQAVVRGRSNGSTSRYRVLIIFYALHEMSKRIEFDHFVCGFFRHFITITISPVSSDHDNQY